MSVGAALSKYFRYFHCETFLFRWNWKIAKENEENYKTTVVVNVLVSVEIITYIYEAVSTHTTLCDSAAQAPFSKLAC